MADYMVIKSMRCSSGALSIVEQDQDSNESHLSYLTINKQLYQLRFYYNLIMKQDDKTFKIIIIGPPGVGKSCLVNRFSRGQYKQGYNPTLGVQFYSRVVNLDAQNTVKLQIWDTAGQQAFRSIIKTFYRSSAAVFLAYSIASLQSFQQLQYWYTEAIQNCNPDAVYVLIGTQKDKQKEQVTSQMAEKFMKDKDLAFMFETSAKTNENVDISFEEAAKQIILKKLSLQIQNQGFDMKGTVQPKKKCEC